MRIRNLRPEHIPSLVRIQQAAALADGVAAMSEADFVAWLTDPELDAEANAFVITDDDDELNPWGQGETLDGLSGEVAGYTLVQLRRDELGYHLLCQGAVEPEYRRQHGGRILLVGAMNHARHLAADFEFEAEAEGIPVYFEALLPVRDPGAASLAAKCEMLPTDEPAPEGLRLYRREL
ncbi:MAG TPA: GNAT family N-acetyltransferase [Ktedonobacteraceae bacterium]|nr:GNAT family N-acetyltransferase [Ktedonobacteraceae bacterium]